MRVGFFTYGMSGERMTGIARYTVELSRALKNKGVEVVLLNPYAASANPWYKEFETHPVPSLKLLPLAATLGNAVLHQSAEQLGLDILHDPCGIAPFLAKRSRSAERSYKRVTTVHDAIPIIYPDTQPRLTRLVFQTLIRAARYTTDAVITVSEASKRDLVKHLNLPEAKLFVTPLGVRPTNGFAALPNEALKDKRYFLYVGALHPRKNLPRVLEAFHALEANHKAYLVITGPPSWGADDTLKMVRQNSRAHDRVQFTGFVSDEVLNTLYRDAYALVFPSLYEGFGLPALEAMQRGTPVISSNQSSLPEVVGDAGLLVDPYSVPAITDAMRELLTNPPLRKHLSTLSLKRATLFSWEHTASLTLRIYEDLLAHKPSVST